MNVATRITPSRITAEEIERRRKMVQSAVHGNAMEGARHGPDVDPIFDAFLNGDIEVTEILPLIKKASEICVEVSYTLHMRSTAGRRFTSPESRTNLRADPLLTHTTIARSHEFQAKCGVVNVASTATSGWMNFEFRQRSSSRTSRDCFRCRIRGWPRTIGHSCPRTTLQEKRHDEQ